MSTCLTQQESAYLRDQGFGLGAIVDNRTRGDVDAWIPLRTAITAELKRRPMLTIHGDGPVGVEKPMPIAHCLAVIDSAPVRAAMARMVTRGSAGKARRR